MATAYIENKLCVAPTRDWTPIDWKSNRRVLECPYCHKHITIFFDTFTRMGGTYCNCGAGIAKYGRAFAPKETK